jgi:hypothetical protein
VSEFEFISILLSIVFGLGLTHLVQGAFQLIANRRTNQIHLLLTAYTGITLTLNWWTFFLWRHHTPWEFGELLVLIAWALWFYVLAIVLYPTDRDRIDVVRSQQLFAKALLGLVCVDVAQTATLGTLFHPWYYLPFVCHYALLAVILMCAKRHGIRLAIAWWLFVSVLLWALVVRRFLAG